MRDMRMMPEELKKRRRALKLRQEDLAELLGVHHLTISNYERGAAVVPKLISLALWAIEHGAIATRDTTAHGKAV
jgi:transcriptional regulator with XRE-family HTH domain